MGARPCLVAVVNKYLCFLLESSTQFSGRPLFSLLVVNNETAFRFLDSYFYEFIMSHMYDARFRLCPFPLFDLLNNNIWQGVIMQLIYGSYLAVLHMNDEIVSWKGIVSDRKLTQCI
jgi:hypothetical protein